MLANGNKRCGLFDTLEHTINAITILIIEIVIDIGMRKGRE